jgi:hypothetical protein
MVGVEPETAAAFPSNGVDEPENRMAEERSAVRKSLMGAVKASKVA